VIESRAMFCPNCGKQSGDSAVFCQSCGVAFQAKTAPTPAPSAGTGAYAGFWVRFVALVIDACILALGSGIVISATFGAGIVLAFVAPWLYEAFMLSSEWQATVGKRAMSIVVTGLDGGRISFARATGRHFAKYVSCFMLGIGFIMAAFTAKKQALHDMMAETLVIIR
jgi:uncharacterized RDD family membrane protein YckC